MPQLFSDEDKNCIVANVKTFVEDIRGSTGFNFDKIVSQLAEADDNGEDYLCTHGNQRYRVPLGDIRKFFESHKKPLPKMTPEQEVKYLRKLLEEKEQQILDLGGAEKIFPTGSTVADVFSGNATPSDIRANFDQAQIKRDPEKPTEIHIPQNQPDERPESEDEIRQRLKDEVKPKQPYNLRDAAAKGVELGERSPKAPEPGI